MASLRSRMLSIMVGFIKNDDILSEDRAKVRIDKSASMPYPPKYIYKNLNVS